MTQGDEKHGLTLGGAASLVAVVCVLVLVSLPRLQAFAVEENEAEAAALAARLAEALGERPADDVALDELARTVGLRGTAGDLAWLDGGRRMRRHGYLFELERSGEAPAVRAWPWAYAETGRAAFRASADGRLLRHPNRGGRFAGPDAPPPAATAGWAPAPLLAGAVW